MTYVHCGTCQRAYNLAIQPTCPSCPVAATVVDPADDIVAAADRLARALARATPAERAAAAARMPQLAIQVAPPPKLEPVRPIDVAFMLASRIRRRVIAQLQRVRALAA